MYKRKNNKTNVCNSFQWTDWSLLENLWQSWRFQMESAFLWNDRRIFFCTMGSPKIQIQCTLHNYTCRPSKLILPMNMEYVKGPTKVINNLANGMQISKPYNVNARHLLALNMYISRITWERLVRKSLTLQMSQQYFPEMSLQPKI